MLSRIGKGMVTVTGWGCQPNFGAANGDLRGLNGDWGGGNGLRNREKCGECTVELIDLCGTCPVLASFPQSMSTAEAGEVLCL